ncbi:MAG: 30S ribosomal protein S6 [Actinobacteria bacterium]|nr:30S ribosomal protein S6 [Actinomycetota bacterium]
MRNYECMIILEPTLEAEAIDDLIARFSDIIAKNGGSVESVNKWGKRRLAYQIGQNTEGYYVVLTLQGENQTVSELDRILKITDGVIRHMIVRLGK